MAANFQFINNFPMVRGKLKREMQVRVTTATLHLKNQIQRKLASGNRTGKTYRVPGTSRSYTASAPDEAPAVLFGRLMNSISWKVVPDVAGVIVGAVGTNVEYAARLEFGFMDTDSKGRRYHQAPRPFMRATFEENRAAILAILSRRM